jgi:hypothetical protein
MTSDAIDDIRIWRPSVSSLLECGRVNRAERIGVTGLTCLAECGQTPVRGRSQDSTEVDPA